MCDFNISSMSNNRKKNFCFGSKWSRLEIQFMKFCCLSKNLVIQFCVSSFPRFLLTALTLACKKCLSKIRCVAPPSIRAISRCLRVDNTAAMALVSTFRVWVRMLAWLVEVLVLFPARKVSGLDVIFLYKF